MSARSAVITIESAPGGGWRSFWIRIPSETADTIPSDPLKFKDSKVIWSVFPRRSLRR